jgi:hypothetical protein
MSTAIAEILNDGFRDSPLNDPRKWGSDGIWNPPFFPVQAYQTKINKIVGTSEGKPIIRLIWAWHSRKWVNEEWDQFGNATKGDWRAKYRFMTVRYGDRYTDLSPPRWILEERFEPGQYMPAWNQTRWQMDPVLGRTHDVGGPAPTDGWYGYLETIALHDKNKECCERAWQTRRARCWGYYKPPGESELNVLRRAKWLLEQDPHRPSPHSPLPQDVIDEIGRKAFDEAEVDATDAQVELQERIKNETDVWGWRLTETDPGRLSHGRYHDLSKNFKKQEKSGLMVPKTI